MGIYMNNVMLLNALCINDNYIDKTTMLFVNDVLKYHVIAIDKWAIIYKLQTAFEYDKNEEIDSLITKIEDMNVSQWFISEDDYHRIYDNEATKKEKIVAIGYHIYNTYELITSSLSEIEFKKSITA